MPGPQQAGGRADLLGSGGLPAPRNRVGQGLRGPPRAQRHKTTPRSSSDASAEGAPQPLGTEPGLKLCAVGGGCLPKNRCGGSAPSVGLPGPNQQAQLRPLIQPAHIGSPHPKNVDMRPPACGPVHTESCVWASSAQGHSCATTDPWAPTPHPAPEPGGSRARPLAKDPGFAGEQELGQPVVGPSPFPGHPALGKPRTRERAGWTAGMSQAHADHALALPGWP